MGLPSPDPPERGRGAGTRQGCAEILLNSEFPMCLLSELHFPAVLGVRGAAPGSVGVGSSGFLSISFGAKSQV